MKPSIGRIVHYQSHGSADGTYKPECRAAIVTAVRTKEVVDLTVFNPEGFFLKLASNYDGGEEMPGNPACEHYGHHAEQPFRYCVCGWVEATKRGGTWHWPEREEEALTKQVSEGLRSIDDARKELGREPWGLPETS